MSPAKTDEAGGRKQTAIYVRVSTAGQDHASQLPDLDRWVANYSQPVTWYRDKFTGKTMDRPGMAKLLAAIQVGRVERIVIWRLDRLGRTARGLCELFEELAARKVDLVSIRDGFNLASPSGRLHAWILASVAEFETEVRAERVRAGQAAARARGVTWGGSEKGRYLKVTPDQEREIMRQVKEQVPIARIARITGLVQADHLPGAGEPGNGTMGVLRTRKRNGWPRNGASRPLRFVTRIRVAKCGASGYSVCHCTRVFGAENAIGLL